MEALVSLPKVLERAIPVYAGDSWSVRLVLRDQASGAVLDLGAWSGWRAWASRSSKVMDLTVDASLAAEGVIRLSLTPEQTRTLRDSAPNSPTMLSFDLESKLGDQVKTWVRGKLQPSDDVTKEA